MNIEGIWSNSNKMMVATGLTLEEAKNLVPDFSNALKKSKIGRPPKLDEQGIFLLMMLYYKHYPTFGLLGLMFEIDPGNAERWVTKAEKVFKDLLAKKNYSHLIRPKPSIEELKSRLLRFRLIN